METTVKFAKLNDTVIIPSKESENAGFDIYANFEDDYIEINNKEEVINIIKKLI